MQSWSLQRKIQVTQTRTLEWYQHYDNQVCINFSGGKDSTVLVDLTARMCSAMNLPLNLIFVNTGLEYPEIRQFVKDYKVWLETQYKITVDLIILKPEMKFNEVIKLYGWNYPSKEVAEAIFYARNNSQWALYLLDGLDRFGNEDKFKSRYKKWKYLFEAPFIISSKCCKVMKEHPLDEYYKENKKYPIVATIANESKRRENSWLKTGCNAFDTQRPISKPISFWTEQDILQYIKQFKIPYCSVYGEVVDEMTNYKRKENKPTGRLLLTGEQRTGCMFCPVGCHLEKEPNKFQRMKITHPKQYEYCIKDEEAGGLGLGKVLDYIGVKY